MELTEFTTDWTSEAYITVSGQNSNNSVRVPNAFMEALLQDGEWPLYGRIEKAKAAQEGRQPKPYKILKARDLWEQINYSAWACADPGLQFDTIINEWHTSPEPTPTTPPNPSPPIPFLAD